MSRYSIGGAVTASLIGTASVIGHAFHLKKQFYPAVVYITSSNLSMMVRCDCTDRLKLRLRSPSQCDGSGWFLACLNVGGVTLPKSLLPRDP